MFNDLKKESKYQIDDQANSSVMDLHEMSKCIVTIQDDNEFVYNFETNADDNNYDDLPYEQNEFVSIESIKKYLGEQNVDYIGTTLQNHLNNEYFNRA